MTSERTRSRHTPHALFHSSSALSVCSELHANAASSSAILAAASAISSLVNQRSFANSANFCVRPITAIVILALAACATVDPPRPPEIRTTTVEVRVPIAIPCFSEAERPVLAPPTPIDIDHATVDQMAAAIAADDLADQLFARAVDALFATCMRRIADGTATQPVGGKP